MPFSKDGHHVLRRSDRFWAGLSTDLVIEQILMRSVKKSRGRGMEEVQRVQWFISMSARAEYSSSLQELTGTEFYTSDQHKQTIESRLKRDQHDIILILLFPEERNPFADVIGLKNTATCGIAEQNVNIDEDYVVGTNIIQYMQGQAIQEYIYVQTM